MTKDILTRKKIKQDYNHGFARQARRMLIVLILWPVFVGSLIALLLIFSPTFSVKILLFVVTLLFVTCIYIASFAEFRKDHRTIESDEFKVVSDRLISTKEKRVGFLFRLSHRAKPYVLEFSSYGSYAIPSGENYHSSENYSMSDQGVFYNAKVGDTFYLVVDKNQRILLAYNTKFFELSEQALHGREHT